MGKVAGIQKNSEGILQVGPEVSVDALYENVDCPAVLKEVIGNAAVWQVRNETSVEKAVSSPSLLPEMTLGLLAMDAQILLDDGGMVLMKEYVKKSGKRGKMAALLLIRSKKCGDCAFGCFTHVGANRSSDDFS